MTAEQWAVAEEVGRDLKRYSEMLVAMDLEDPFYDLLRGWSHGLAVLAWEMYEACLVLVRASHLRAAFGLGRCLLDYYLRLNFYHEESLAHRGGWKYDGQLLPAGCPSLYQTIAYRDWANMIDKMSWYMKQWHDYDLSGLDDEGKNLFQEMMSREYEQYQTQVKKMLQKLKGAAAHVSEIKAEYGMRSGYLHGDQSALYELFMYADTRPDNSASYEARFSEARILGANAQFVVLLMDAMGDATGRRFAISDVLLGKLIAAFGIS